MKKILFATTALVATAGIASAQDLGVSLSGGAEMGIFDNGNDNSQFFTDIDVTFTMSGEADNGLTFGANIDLDESTTGAAFAAGTQGGEVVFISFGGATLTMGDTDGAMDAAMPEMALAGSSLADDETGHVGFDDQDGHLLFTDSGLSLDGNGDGQIARLDYTYDAFTFSVSAEQAEDGFGVYLPGNPIGAPAGYDANPIYGLGVSYAAEYSGITVDAGLGFQTQEDIASSYGLAVVAGFSNGFSVGLTGSKTDIDDNVSPGLEITHFGVGVGYEMNNIAIGANYGKYEANNGGGEIDGYGLAAAYDLGGGLSANFGYGFSDFGGGVDSDTYSLGLRMSF